MFLLALFIFWGKTESKPIGVIEKEVESCKLVLNSVFLNIPNCEKIEIKVYGCRGTCESSSYMMLDKIQQTGSCCEPNKKRNFTVPMNCSTSENNIKHVKLTTAESCSCKKRNFLKQQ